jgi:hypothetical protein
MDNLTMPAALVLIFGLGGFFYTVLQIFFFRKPDPQHKLGPELGERIATLEGSTKQQEKQLERMQEQLDEVLKVTYRYLRSAEGYLEKDTRSSERVHSRLGRREEKE